MVMSVRPSVRVSVHPTLRPSIRPSVRVSVRQFSTLFSNMLWDFELKFRILLCFTVLQIKCHQFASSFVGVMPLLELKILEIHSFPHFSATCLTYWAEILHMTLHMTLFYCTTDQVRVSSICVNFCWSCAPFGTFLQHALTYWAEILHMTLIYCTTDQVRVSSISVNFLLELCPFWNLEYLKYSFPHFSPTCFDILSRNSTYDFVSLNYRSSLSVVNLRQFLWGFMPLLELRILEIHIFPDFSLTCFDILSWNFAYDFILLYFRSDSCVVNLCQFLWELCPFWNSEYWKYTVFCSFLLHALTYWTEILHMTLFYCNTDQFRVWSICVNFYGSLPLLELRILEVQFSTLFSYMLWHIELNFFIWLSLMYYNKYRISLSVVTLCPSILAEI